MIPRIFAALERGHCCVRRMVLSILILIGRPLEMEVGMEPLEPQFGEQCSSDLEQGVEWVPWVMCRSWAVRFTNEAIKLDL